MQRDSEIVQLNVFVAPTIRDFVRLEAVRSGRTMASIVSECVIARLARDRARVNREARKQKEIAHAAPAR